MRRLPPIRALQSFEVAANHENFSRAAEALCLTHSAISHQVRTLESWFGQKLFARHPGGVTLTEEGEQLKSACMTAFSLLEERCAGIRARVSERKLTIACSTSFLALWLLPRIERFSKQLPELVLSFQTPGDVASLLTRKVDVLILSDRASASDAIDATCVATDVIGPVCAPGWTSLPLSPRDIGTVPVLHARSRPSAWKEWANEVGVSVDLRRGQTLDSLSLTIEAARSGLGFAIAPEMLVRRDLAERRLIAPLGFATVERATYLYVSASRRQQADIAAFREWLITEADSDSPACF